MEKKLLDESEEVQKLLESFCCKYPVTPDSESQPSSFKVKTGPEDDPEMPQTKIYNQYQAVK